MPAMKINDIPTRTIWATSDDHAVDIIDQTALPHEYRTLRLNTLEDAAHAIRSMQVRGAPLIGVAAAYGLAAAMGFAAGGTSLSAAIAMLANHLGARGEEIPAGTMILSGGVTEAVAVKAGDHVNLRIQSLGSSSVRFV